MILFFFWGIALSAPVPITDTSLIDHNGRGFRAHDLKGQYTLISFIFTRCPHSTMCPLTTRMNKRVLTLWKKQKLASKPELHFLLVTLDPEFDTPNVLKKYANDQKLDLHYFTLATGAPKALSDFAAEFNIVAFPAGASLSHNVKTILVGPDLKEIHQYKDNEWKPEQVVKSLVSQMSGAATTR